MVYLGGGATQSPDLNTTRHGERNEADKGAKAHHALALALQLPDHMALLTAQNDADRKGLPRGRPQTHTHTRPPTS